MGRQRMPARGGGARPGFRRGPAARVVARGPATPDRCRMALSHSHRRRDIAVGERSQPEPASAAIGRRDHVGYLDRRPGCCGRLIPGPPGVPQSLHGRPGAGGRRDPRPRVELEQAAARRCRRCPDNGTSETSDPVRSRRPRRVAGRGRRGAVAAAPPRDEHLRGGPGDWLAASTGGTSLPDSIDLQSHGISTPTIEPNDSSGGHPAFHRFDYEARSAARGWAAATSETLSHGRTLPSVVSPNAGCAGWQDTA